MSVLDVISAPTLSRLGEDLCVPFSTKRIRKARVIWLNERYLFAQGIDCRDAEMRRSLKQCLLENFAQIADEYGGKHVLFADRYGGPAGVYQGGSGRVGSIGPLNAKGIGRTPLVGEVDWDHSHGFLLLADAIKEAVSAEIADAELPNGAIPILAIIDTGGKLKYRCGRSEPTAIVVRPNFVRPAHFERSVYFGTSGFPTSDQVLDARRVKQMVAAANSGAIGTQCDAASMTSALARQLGAARAHRLWNGRPISSNFTIHGSVADSGTLRSVPNWQRVRAKPGEIFGDEEGCIAQIFKSVEYYFNKYKNFEHSQAQLSNIEATIRNEIQSAFVKTCLEGVGSNYDENPALVDAFLTYYHVQQKHALRDGPDPRREIGWIGTVTQFGKTYNPLSAHDAAAAQLLLVSLKALHDRSRTSKAGLSKVRLFLSQRPSMYYDNAVSAARVAAHQLQSQKDWDLDAFISQQISAGRRHWKKLPADMSISGQVIKNGVSAVYGSRCNVAGVWIEAPRLGDQIFLFDHRVKLDDFPFDLSSDEHVSKFFPVEVADFQAGACLTIGGRSLRIPGPQMRFEGQL